LDSKWTPKAQFRRFGLPTDSCREGYYPGEGDPVPLGVLLFSLLMLISVEQIDAWRHEPTETEVLEFKEAKNQFDTEKLFAYCVAIGNEGGGHLLLGIHNDPPRHVVGTRAIDNPTGMSEKIFNKLGFRVDIEVVQHPDGRIVVLRIPACPRGTPYHLDGSYLMRVGESLQPRSPDRLRRILLAGNGGASLAFSSSGRASKSSISLG